MSRFDPPLEWLRAKQGVKWHRPGPQLLPAWVADMDFALAPPIDQAIRACLDRGDLGYPDWSEHPLAVPFGERMSARFGWAADPSRVRGVTDLLQALQLVLHLATSPGDGVIAHVPNYPPFLATLPTMQRRLVPAPIAPAGATWTWDADDLARRARAERATVLLLVNPHNPSGRVLSRDELERLAELAGELDLLVISDEIHADLTHDPARHVPFASLSDDTARRTVTVTSATKAFNIAGLRTAVAHVGSDRLLDRWDAQPPDLFGATNVLGVEATRAAWQHGGPWLAELRGHLAGQRQHLTERLAALAGISARVPEAGYLSWLDCSGLGLDEPAVDHFRRAGLELSAGADFDPAATACVRLNFATSRAVLDALLDRLIGASG